MKKQLLRLIKLLSLLNSLHDILINVGEKKRTALVDINMEDLPAIIDEEKRVTNKLYKVEQERLRLVGSIHTMHFSDNSLIRLETILMRAPEPEKQELIKQRDILREKARALQALNKLNKSLCDQGLSTVTYYMDVLTTPNMATTRSYDMHARKSEPVRLHLLDKTG